MTEPNEKSAAQETAQQTPPAEERTPEQAQEAASSPQEEDMKGKKHGKEARISELEARVTELEATAAAQSEQYKRMLAEYDNFRKRTLRERESFYTDAVCVTAAAFLPVLDNLERAAAAEDAPEGTKLILRQFCEILEKLNIQPFGTEGDPFDPQKHNALLHADGEGGDTVVAQVLQKGYTHGERVIRHADVKTTD
ncbi:MAG: nucleotide exchange factor GrpE [Clostridiaceae bacterium]|nr:nucleotide exchange factor GrpE [Clostridiaceae bacterium]